MGVCPFNKGYPTRNDIVPFSLTTKSRILFLSHPRALYIIVEGGQLLKNLFSSFIQNSSHFSRLLRHRLTLFATYVFPFLNSHDALGLFGFATLQLRRPPKKKQLRPRARFSNKLRARKDWAGTRGCFRARKGEKNAEI